MTISQIRGPGRERWACRAATAVLATAATVGCTREGSRPAPGSGSTPVIAESGIERLAGCYALFDHRGGPASDSLYWAPDGVELRTDPAPHTFGMPRPGARELRMLGHQPERSDTEILYWAPDTLSAGRIRVVFSSGFSGTELTLPATAPTDTLRGWATERWDSGPPFETDGGAVTAVRVPCPGTAAR